MKTLRQIIQDFEEKGLAIGHFNVSDLATLKAIFLAAENIKVPVIIGVSEGEREFIGTKTIAMLIRSLREETGYPIFLNADHTHSLEGIKEVLKTGFDAVLFDGAKLSLKENIRKTKEAVEYIKSKNPTILVEGELGYIGGSSEILKNIPEGAAIEPEDFTTPKEAEDFVRETKVDLLAPAVGNIHGMLKDSPHPSLDIERIRAIKKAVRIPLVLHGGSGIPDSQLQDALRAGISIVHINTELRKTWRESLEETLTRKPDEVAPYRLLDPVVVALQKLVERKLKILSLR